MRHASLFPAEYAIPESLATAGVITPSAPRPGIFFYTDNLTEDFQDQNLPRNFRNLKKSIKRHFVSEGHNQNVNDAEKIFEENLKFISKNQTVGMRCGR